MQLLATSDDLIRGHSSKKFVLLILLVLIAVIAASPNDSNKVGRDAREGLLIENGPILVSILKVACRERVLDYDRDREQWGNGPDWNDKDPEALSILEVALYQKWHKYEELHLTGEIPGPRHATIFALPGNQVVQEGEMPYPMLVTLVRVLVLEKEWPLSSKERNNAPKEEQCESVKGPQTHKATENYYKFVAWQSSVIETHLDQELVAGQETWHPEEHIDKEVGGEDKAKEWALDPLLDDLQILNRALQGVEVGISENDHDAEYDSQAVQDFELLISLLCAWLAELSQIIHHREASEEPGAGWVITWWASAASTWREAARVLSSIITGTAIVGGQSIALQFQSILLLRPQEECSHDCHDNKEENYGGSEDGDKVKLSNFVVFNFWIDEADVWFCDRRSSVKTLHALKHIWKCAVYRLGKEWLEFV